MTITHKISIDLLRQEQPARIDAVQNDCGRTLALMLHANGIPWPVPEGVTALVRYRKSDNIGGEYDTLPDGSTACRADGNVLTVALAPQVLTTAGETKLSVLLVKGSAAIRTFHILLQVQPEESCYEQVRGIVKVLNYIQQADVDDEIPPTSLVREFIGGNSFYK